MILQLQQKYFTIGGDKFNITDQNGNPVYQAKEIFFRVRGNAHLYDLQGREICYMEAKLWSWFGQYNIMTDENSKNLLGVFKGTFYPVPFVKRWRLDYMGKKFVVKCGPYNCKVFEADDQWHYDKKVMAGHIRKRLMKIRDTYSMDFDENILPPQIAAIITLWFDTAFHNNQH
ncbi:MAG: LURP-one-related family protein [Clostridia bacterium]|nr:LURP-one-related family protein [Clostridia bacterium]MBR2918875.1 LURP-one-related family protein [Clostridia bacterium]